MGKNRRSQLFLLGVSVSIVALLVSPALGKEQKAPPSPPAAPSVSGTSEKEAKEKEAKDFLNGTRWSLELVPLSGPKEKKPLKDSLRFDQGRLTSEVLSKEGYPASNITLTVGDDGITVWETMQTQEDTGVVFWRGEVQENSMRGVLSKHPVQGDSVDFSFSGTLKERRPPLAPATAPGRQTRPSP